jgi:hypothetical protein
MVGEKKCNQRQRGASESHRREDGCRARRRRISRRRMSSTGGWRRFAFNKILQKTDQVSLPYNLLSSIVVSLT